MTELKPCPFCGGEAEMLTAESMNGGYLFGIMCNDCRSRGDVYGTEAEAIAAWNTRYERTCRNIKDQLRGIGATEFMCSECRAYYADAESYYAYLSCDDDEGEVKTNYCPNCGAKVVYE